MVSEGWERVPKQNARTGVRRRSGGLIALVLAASVAASSPITAAPGARASLTPATGPAAREVSFPQVESQLASGRFVHGPPSSVTGSIPSTVLVAYRRATEWIAATQPNCHLPLELLAAIGKVESGHARDGQVDAKGRTLSPILGPVLNGGSFAAIPDTDDGRLDGDTTWDRAVGPMQFIPSTWSTWQSDADDDGNPDPHNVYDASLAAARYLCAANRDLSTPTGLDEAVLSYNRSASYLLLVRSWLSIYKAGATPADVPVDTAWTPPTDFLPPAAEPVTATPVTIPPAAPPVSTPPPAATPPTTPPAPPTTPPAPQEPAPEIPAEEQPEPCDLLGTRGPAMEDPLAELEELLDKLPTCVTSLKPPALPDELRPVASGPPVSSVVAPSDRNPGSTASCPQEPETAQPVPCPPMSTGPPAAAPTLPMP